MSEAIDYLFGPLESSEFCSFFLVLMIFGFVFFVMSVILLMYGIFNKTGNGHFMKAALIVCFYFIFYLKSRIFYSMCLGSLK